MLTENQIRALPERIAQRLSDINTEYLEEVGRVLKKIGELRPKDVHQLQQMYNYGADMDRVINKLEQVSGKNVQEIYEIFDIVAKENYDYSKPFYEAQGMKFIPYDKNEDLQGYVKSLAKQTAGEYINLTQHTAFAVFDKGGKSIAPLYAANKDKIATSLSDTYTKLVDYAVTKVQLGEESYQKAVKDICKAMVNSGIKTVDYASGYSRNLESAVRQNVLWGVKECNQNTADRIGEEFGADGYEVSYHSNPRETHADMAGKHFAKGPARTVNGMFYPSFEEIAEPLLNEYNCLHFKFSILLGISVPAYSKEELEAFKAEDNKTFEFEGKTYTKYEASQVQSALERKMVTQKELANMAKAAGDDDLRREAQGNINLLASKYNDFCKASGLPTRAERMNVSGFRKVKTNASKLAKSNDNWEKAIPTSHTKEDIEKLISYAKDRKVKIYNAYGFDGDINLLKEQINIIEHMQKEYGITRRITVRFADMKDGDYADYDKGVITFNKKILRNRGVTNANLNADNILSCISTDGIASHEMAHMIAEQYGIKGIDIAKKAYYNVYGESVSEKDLILYLRDNVSKYSVKQKKSGKRTSYVEILPETVAKHCTNPDKFTREFIRIMRERI